MRNSSGFLRKKARIKGALRPGQRRTWAEMRRYRETNARFPAHSRCCLRDPGRSALRPSETIVVRWAMTAVDPKRKFHTVRTDWRYLTQSGSSPKSAQSLQKRSGFARGLVHEIRAALSRNKLLFAGAPNGGSAFAQVIAAPPRDLRNAEGAAVAEATRGRLQAGSSSGPSRRRFAPLAWESPGKPEIRPCSFQTRRPRSLRNH